MPAASSARTMSSTARYISWNIAREPAQIARDRGGSFLLHGAVLGDQPQPEGRDARAASPGAAGGGRDHALAIVLVERFDQLPRAPVRHAHRSRRGRNGAGLGDALDQLRLARAHRRPALAQNTQDRKST